jgi:hypothetical protein
MHVPDGLVRNPRQFTLRQPGHHALRFEIDSFYPDPCVHQDRGGVAWLILRPVWLADGLKLQNDSHVLYPVTALSWCASSPIKTS